MKRGSNFAMTYLLNWSVAWLRWYIIKIKKSMQRYSLVPHSFAKKLVRQEWNKWDIDAFFPMNYNDFYLKGTNWIGQMCREEVIATLQKKPIYSGLFICTNWENKAKETDPENFGLFTARIRNGNKRIYKKWSNRNLSVYLRKNDERTLGMF